MGEYADYQFERWESSGFGINAVKRHLKKTSKPNKKLKCNHCAASVFWEDVDGKWVLFHHNKDKKKELHQCTKKDKVCNTCGEKFVWRQFKERWLPHNLDGKLHICKPKELQDIPEITDKELLERFGS